MDEALSIAAVFTSVIAIYKIVVGVALARSNRRRDEYAFTKQFISDIYENSEHRYTLEKGFFALTGKLYSIEEIKVLLSQKNPSLAINQRRSSSGFISFDNSSTSYSWQGRYTKPFAQKHAGKCFFWSYVIAASLALMPIYTKGLSLFSQLPAIAYTLSLLVVAISFLVQQANFDTAKDFMEKIESPGSYK